MIRIPIENSTYTSVMKFKTIAVAAVLIVAALGTYWHFSPQIAIHSMQSAAESRDADSFNDHVDFPALRESLKGQLTAMMVETMSQADKGNPFASLGAMMGMTMVNQMVDAFVRPETVMKMMAEGRAKPVLGPTDTTPVSSSPAPSSGQKSTKWQLERINADKVIAFNGEDRDVNGGRAGLVFVRSGFASWKLSELRLPATASN